MLIGFVGVPGSGKSTVAAAVFSELKKMGLVTEFIPEQARWYIAKYRFDKGLAPTDPVQLKDTDQLEIMLQQLEVEENLLAGSNFADVLITDSSAVNSLLYMSPTAQQSAFESEYTEWSENQYDLLILCRPVPDFVDHEKDPNRIHTQQQAEDLANWVEPTLEEWFPSIPVKIVAGSIEERVEQVLETVLALKARADARPA